jgi:hypothetical protein
MTEPWKVHTALMAYRIVPQQALSVRVAQDANKAWIDANGKVDYEKLMLDEHGSYTTKDPYPLWKQISGMYQYASSHGFDYLLHTNKFTPRPKLSEANRRLAVAYANGRLDTHLDMFTRFMDMWLVNFPNTHSWNVHGSSYRKDQCICDEEIDGEVTVIDSEMLKLEKKAKKAKAEAPQ